jgi:hypothetical protein
MNYRHIVLLLLLASIFGCSKNDTDKPQPNTPLISAMFPLTGPKFTTVTLTGLNFGNDTSVVAVFMNGKRMNLQSVSPSTITFIVPPRTGSGLVSLTVNGQSVSGPFFSYQFTITVSTFSGLPGTSGFMDGAAATALFNRPLGLEIDALENLYVADELNHRIRRISSSGDVVTFAGSGISGHMDGQPGTARFQNPSDVTIDHINGNLFVADKMNHCIRKITPTGIVSTVAGVPGSAGYVDAPGQSARLNLPTGIALEGEMPNIYIADQGNHCIRKLDPFEVLSTFAGSQNDGQGDGTGTGARFTSPVDIVWDSAGFLYVTDMVNQNVRRISKSTAAVVTIAGSGATGFVNGPGAIAEFDSPSGIVSVLGKIRLCDGNNHSIRSISPSKQVTTLTGTGVAGFVNGDAAIAQFNNPGGMVQTRDGDLFIADTDNHCIRKITID